MSKYSAAVLAALPLAAAEWEANQRRQADADAERAARLLDANAATAILSPLQWAEQNATIVLPTEGRQPFSPYPYQRALLDDRSPRRVVLKARQTGLSNAIAIEALHLAITRPDSTILFVSRNQQAARVLITYAQHTINGLRVPPVLTNETQGELAFPNGSRIISLPATASTGRGFAATRVYLDEFAFCPYDDLILESIMGTVSTGGDLTVLSTANGRNNVFFRLWSGVEGGVWNRHRVHWSDCPRYDTAWAERTRAGMTRQAFAQEYDLDFLTSGDAVFDPSDLALCADGWRLEPTGCDDYVTAWDIGRRQDHTVGITMGLRGADPDSGHMEFHDGNPVVVGAQPGAWHVVAFERFLAPYPVIQARIEARARTFGGRHVVESNGVGDPVIENLNVRVEPFTTTAKTKVQAIQALQLLIQQRRFKHAEAQLSNELSLYEWLDAGLVQDSVMAASIAAITVQKPSRQVYVY